MSESRLKIAKLVVCYLLMIWYCFLSQNLASSAFNSFAEACNTAEMKISTAKTEVLHLSTNPDQCMLQVKEATLKKVRKFKYLGVAFASDGRQDEELNTPNWQG